MNAAPTLADARPESDRTARPSSHTTTFSCTEESCGRAWQSLKEVHCSSAPGRGSGGGCHRHFSGYPAYDRHIIETRGTVVTAKGHLVHNEPNARCATLAEFTQLMRNGRPRLCAVNRPGGTVWITATRSPESLPNRTTTSAVAAADEDGGQRQ
jgi:hypothetical protein